MKQYDLVIIGGGSAGMAAALGAYKKGIYPFPVSFIVLFAPMAFIINCVLTILKSESLWSTQLYLLLYVNLYTFLSVEVSKAPQALISIPTPVPFPQPLSQ